MFETRNDYKPYLVGALGAILVGKMLLNEFGFMEEISYEEYLYDIDECDQEEEGSVNTNNIPKEDRKQILCDKKVKKQKSKSKEKFTKVKYNTIVQKMFSDLIESIENDDEKQFLNIYSSVPDLFSDIDQHPKKCLKILHKNPDNPLVIFILRLIQLIQSRKEKLQVLDFRYKKPLREFYKFVKRAKTLSVMIIIANNKLMDKLYHQNIKLKDIQKYSTTNNVSKHLVIKKDKKVIFCNLMD